MNALSNTVEQFQIDQIRQFSANSALEWMQSESTQAAINEFAPIPFYAVCVEDSRGPEYGRIVISINCDSQWAIRHQTAHELFEDNWQVEAGSTENAVEFLLNSCLI